MIWQELGVEALGIFFVITSSFTILSYMLSLGLDAGLEHMSKIYPNIRSELLGVSLFVAFVWCGSASIIIFLTLFKSLDTIFPLFEKDILLVGSISILPMCLSTYCFGILIGQSRRTFVKVIVIAKGIVILVCLIYSIALSVLTTELALSIWVGVEVIVSAALLIRLLIITKLSFEIKVRKLLSYIKSCAIRYLVSFFYWLHRISDIIVLCVFASLADLGQYTLAVLSIGVVWRIPEFWTMRYSRPTYSESAVQLIAKSLRIAFTVSCLAAFSILLIGWFFSMLVFGADFDKGYLLFIQLVPGAILLAQSRILIHEKGIKSSNIGLLVLTFIALSLNISISLVLIPIWGPAGAAIAFSISHVTLSTVLLHNFRRQIESKWSDLFVLKQGDLELSKIHLLSI